MVHILGRIKEVSHDLSKLLRLRQKIKGIKKVHISTTTLRVLAPSFINWGVHLSSTNFRSRNCA